MEESSHQLVEILTKRVRNHFDGFEWGRRISQKAEDMVRREVVERERREYVGSDPLFSHIIVDGRARH